ncbi:MAG: YbaB/EbfC family nucleoid-associated protein [Clostridia bacterium]|nr:YbaB/EbfC family nucleoid-associated protein [Clostridia bacterium]
MNKKFGGFGAGANMQQLMKQAQVMQQKMAQAQQELEESEVTGSSGGDKVVVVMNGKQKLLSISISPDVVDPQDVEMLEDLIMAAVNDASNKAQELSDDLLAPFGGAGGLL